MKGVSYLAHGVPVAASEIFLDREVRPEASGPWVGEADKIAWRDPATGYECIILRDGRWGQLGGYVGVPSSHPLYRYKQDAVPVDLGIQVHGGIIYAAACQDGPRPRSALRYEARRICHVAVGHNATIDATDYRIEDRDAWWFGFTCDHIADVIPNDPRYAERGAALGIIQVYRDDAYVLGEVNNLAAQPRAIADGTPVPDRGGSPAAPRVDRSEAQRVTACDFGRSQAGLPWGWWLRATARGLEDGRCGVWPDVRTAFWEGRLGMCSAHVASEQQELLLLVLNWLEAPPGPLNEGWHDLFGGDAFFWRFYMCWLGSVGLTEAFGGLGTFYAATTEEGRSVLAMLRATRDPRWIDLPMAEVVEAVRRSGRGAAEVSREAALRAFESGMTPLLHVFGREKVGRAHLVTLTSIDPTDRMPMRRVAWSASFLDERSRDDLFGWLAERVHRWKYWGRIARRGGASGLTAHLLGLLVVSPIGREASVYASAVPS